MVTLIKQGVLCDELYMYKSMSGAHAQPLARDGKRMHYVVKWWETIGAHINNLQSLAPCVLSQGTCSSSCGRNWSTFSLIHTELRIKLLLKNTEISIYLYKFAVCKSNQRKRI
ncbi:hypothetical protein KP509_16G025700 [Ceratopteris richardii]|uniref:HAT C-terminal dimerisation domain-containing protein n=1 Tax=Ceratopteris richardii TaxID=49495 RepID=A0A8T2T1T2_CERRI|nr:hypothetical protein KP509_16G025700 [Ceratopteris richardii]